MPRSTCSMAILRDSGESSEGSLPPEDSSMHLEGPELLKRLVVELPRPPVPLSLGGLERELELLGLDGLHGDDRASPRWRRTS